MENNKALSWEDVPDFPLGSIAGEVLWDENISLYRAVIVKRAFRATYEDSDRPKQCIRDMLADLRSLCGTLGINFAELDQEAGRLYADETYKSNPNGDSVVDGEPKEWISDAEWTQFCMPRTDGTRHEKMSKDEAEELLTWKYGAPPAAVNTKPQEPGRWLANNDLGSYFRRDEEGRIFQAPMLEDGTIERNADGTVNECYVDPLEISDMEFAQVDDWLNEILGERETYLN